VSGWRDIATAPRDGSEVLLMLGETIPDHFDIRAGSYLDGDASEELGWREYAEYGSWMIWNDSNNWFLIDIDEPLAWTPIPLWEAETLTERPSFAHLSAPLPTPQETGE
jgi:hypothetical protein